MKDTLYPSRSANIAPSFAIVVVLPTPVGPMNISTFFLLPFLKGPLVTILLFNRSRNVFSILERSLRSSR